LTKSKKPYIAVTNEFPDHPKTMELSDKAFRKLVTLWCWCNRNKTDGRVPKGYLNEHIPPKVRKELIDHEWLEKRDGEWFAHDYLDHQKSRVEIDQLTQDKKASGSRGGMVAAHKRWHLDRGEFDPNCLLCVDLTG